MTSKRESKKPNPTSNKRVPAIQSTETDASPEETESGKKKPERYFKRIDPDTLELTGRYIGDPEQAASKSFTKMLFKMREAGEKLPKKQIICLRESTRGSPKKVYCYEVVRLKLKEPQVLKVTNPSDGKVKTINYRFRNKLRKVDVPENLKALKESKKKKTPSVHSSKEELIYE